MVILFVVFQCVFLSFLAYFFVVVANVWSLSEKGIPSCKAGVVKVHEVLVPPQMDFIACQSGSRIKRVTITFECVRNSRKIQKQLQTEVKSFKDNH